MKILLALLLGLALALRAAAEPSSIPLPPRLEAGAVAPEFVSYDLAGHEVRLADYRGKVVILDFWATWCSPCIASMPHTQEVAARYADQGVVVLAVCTGDKRGRFEDWVRLKAAAYPNLRFTFDPHEQGTPAHDQRASAALYGAATIPAQFILDRNGRIVGTTSGYLPGDTQLEAALAKAGIDTGQVVAEPAPVRPPVVRPPASTDKPAAARPVPPPYTVDAVKLKAGQVMADLVWEDAAGATRALSTLRGRPLVLCFAPAEAIPADFLDAVVARYGADGVQVVALVTRDSRENYRAWLDLHRGRHQFETVFDPAGATAMRESAVFLAVGMVVPMPMVLVLDHESRLVGKVAPKVPTSTRGLAELLRRTGVNVRPDELPTPEMMAAAARFAESTRPAAASEKPAAPAPATAPAAPAEPAPVAGSAADRDYAAFVALRSESPPGKPKEMGGMEKYFAWVDARAKDVTAAALAFYAAYPQDPRRWDVVMTLINRAPIFMRAFEAKPDKVPSIADVIVDEPAKRAWTEQADRLRAALLAAPDSLPEQREQLEFAAFAAESRGARARVKSLSPAEARAAWEALRDRFDAHVARYTGLPRLALEAENFLTAWKDAVPGSLVDGCKHLVTSPDEGVRKFATERLAALERLGAPLELKFVAVDGRPVDLQALRGKVVLVDFWATWCGPCIAELPNVKKVYAAYHDKGFEVIGISLENAQLTPKDTPEQQAAKLAKAKQVLTDFTAKDNMPWPQYFDGKWWKNDFATRYGIGAIPAMFLVDQEGKIVSTNARGEKLEAEVKRLLKL